MLMRPRVRAALAWAAVLVVAALFFWYAWTGYDRPNHPDGNIGHVFIDFSGQWLMGRMLVRGEGNSLYKKARLREALREAYSADDAATIDGWLIESTERRGVGGALYPPIHALLFYPLGQLSPPVAYRIIQLLNFLLTFVVGFLAWKLTRGRLWASVSVGALMGFPGYLGAISLGQNSLVSLTLLLLGWLLMDRGRPWWGGAVWGLLAFKPVWAVTFFVVPLLMRRWRVCVAMALAGIAMALLTLPFVGWQSWLDWLAVGRAASAHYGTDETWIFLSRDLQGLPRRYLLHFTEGLATNADRLLPDRLGFALWLAAAALTLFVAAWRWRRPAGFSGTPAAFLLLGAWLSCFHFMYYDVLLALLPVYLLLADLHQRTPRRAAGFILAGMSPAARLLLVLLALLFVAPHIADGVDYLATNGKPIFHSPPFDTFCLLALWVWCGWQCLRNLFRPAAAVE